MAAAIAQGQVPHPKQWMLSAPPQLSPVEAKKRIEAHNQAAALWKPVGMAQGLPNWKPVGMAPPPAAKRAKSASVTGTPAQPQEVGSLAPPEKISPKKSPPLTPWEQVPKKPAPVPEKTAPLPKPQGAATTFLL